MKIKTKSGFVCDVDEKKAADWDFVDALVDCESDNESTRVIAARNCIKLLLGKDGAAALAEHVKDENGVKNIGKMLVEFKEIMALIGDKQKKSASSQA
jgi:hypothetical protein